jgi:hypothetical protein
MKQPSQARMLYAWSPAGGTILRGGKNFRKWGLVEGRRSLGVHLWRWHLVPCLCIALCFLSTMRWSDSATCSYCCNFLTHHGPRSIEPNDYRLNPEKVSRHKSFLLKFFLSGIFSSNEKSNIENWCMRNGVAVSKSDYVVLKHLELVCWRNLEKFRDVV